MSDHALIIAERDALEEAIARIAGGTWNHPQQPRMSAREYAAQVLKHLRANRPAPEPPPNVARIHLVDRV